MKHIFLRHRKEVQRKDREIQDLKNIISEFESERRHYDLALLKHMEDAKRLAQQQTAAATKTTPMVRAAPQTRTSVPTAEGTPKKFSFDLLNPRTQPNSNHTTPETSAACEEPLVQRRIKAAAPTVSVVDLRELRELIVTAPATVLTRLSGLTPDSQNVREGDGSVEKFYNR